ncbi:PilT/PilU family type 4a pilus ATPase [Patescibacteria group bacterium]|nr:PilT/PilU family type 4a pilus ATPase [Patescibacteria group bacterium]MBU1015950.1 PilT/PilU family type 4a pilus ATPase [Patescibacteria group bacterium]MBU1685298.1 PilT/PilU family type 4a pilus ATPase [Patescibacteria group bacterium]MBU1939085.1 PilT/PilU family type 4a pilus ATPase [Patescibacteria group bacterium]
MADEQNIQQAAASAAETTLTHASSAGITLDQLVSIAIEQDASDIHFGEEGRIALRVGGKFVFVENVDKLSKADSEAMVKEMLPGEAEQKRLKTLREMDFSYIHSSGVSFRVNVYFSRGMLTVSMRMISKHLPKMNELGIPEVMKQFLSFRQGLILVTGTTGSGKSTSIQAMLDFVNDTFVYHVITIENPIEHVFKENKSIFSQRELGKDTLTFANAIHSATREDPDIIMISEINDRETMDAVLNLVEMGHLVIASIPTKNVLQTIEHVIAMYPHEEQEIMQDRFAENLAVIMSQDLLDRIDQPGRAAVYEVMVADKGIKNIIKRSSLSQLRTAMESGAQQGTITMDAYAYQLAENGIISKEDMVQYAHNQD